MPSVLRRFLFGASLAVVSSGCQLAFGDFTLDTSDAGADSALGSACAPNTFLCNGAHLEACAPDRRSFQPVADCTDADHCDPLLGACHPCAVGSHACNGNVLEACVAPGRWSTVMTCATDELCSRGLEAGGTQCGAGDCDTPGTYSCDGNRLYRCSAAFERTLVDRCGSAALCDADKAASEDAPNRRGTCEPPACRVGEFACDGKSLKRCSDDETGWQAVTDCADAVSCNPSAGSCDPCTLGTWACSGGDLLACGPQGFTKTATCAAPELCDASAGRCLAAECQTPGALRCSPPTDDLPSLEECGNDRRWAVREVCASRALCSERTGACLPPACGPDQTRCLGDAHQTCSDDRARYDTDRVCASGTCSPDSGCTTEPCTNDSTRCNGALRESCVEGAWQSVERCATAALCQPDGCMAPECSVPDVRCDGDSKLEQCTWDRTWSMARPCGSDSFCDADPGFAACDACQPLAYSCVDTPTGHELHRCLSDGSAAPFVSSCPGGCSVAGDAATCAQ